MLYSLPIFLNTGPFIYRLQGNYVYPKAANTSLQTSNPTKKNNESDAYDADDNASAR